MVKWKASSLIIKNILVRIKALAGQCILSVHCSEVYMGGQMIVSRLFRSMELDDLNGRFQHLGKLLFNSHQLGWLASFPLDSTGRRLSCLCIP